MTDRYDVAIVGYGPTGEAAANLLGAYGMKVAVFETATSIYNQPRAVHFDSEIMRCFQSMGLAEAVLPSTKRLLGMHFHTAGGKKLFGYDMPERTTSNGWYADYLFYQPELEAALQEGVRRFPNVEVYAGHEVLAMEQDADGVTVRVRDLDSRAERTVVAGYVIGCDGARSITRKMAGIVLEDLVFDQPWLVVDVMLKRDVDLPNVGLQICDPNRPTTFVPSRGNHRRWELMLMPGDTEEEMIKHERVWDLLSRWITPDDAEIARAVVYSFHALIAKEWRRDRIFIAGDSAHQMPPFLGQGMCSGIRDAVNLAWKLDLAMNGKAADALLDTYQQERAPHVRTIIERAVAIGGIIQTTDPEVAAKRDERFLNGPPPGAGSDSPMAAGVVPLAAGCFAGDDERVGRLLPQHIETPEGDDLRLDDLLGPRFAVVAPAEFASAEMVENDPVVASTYIALTKESDPAPDGWTAVPDHSGRIRDWLGNKIVLVRPDRYVYGVASNASELAQLQGSLTETLGAKVPA